MLASPWHQSMVMEVWRLLNISLLLKMCVTLSFWPVGQSAAEGTPPVRTAEGRPANRAAFLNALLYEYDSTVTPTFEKWQPTFVNVSIHINNIDAVNEQTMDFTLNLFVTQTWRDFRLEFHELIADDYLELDSKLISRFWVPDLYFVNEKSSNFHDVTVPNTLLHLHSDGRVVFKMRISLTATCYMALHKFPMDLQNCSFLMRSFGYTSRSLQFHWREKEPLTRHSKLEMSQFALIGLSHRTCHGVSDHNESFTCLAVDLELRRSLGFYMIQLYIPSALIVVLSWVSFCLDVGAVPARISLGILTVLTMTNMKTIAVASLPKVSYIKAIDVWMAACLAFVFSALLEFAVVNAVARRQKKIPWDVVLETEPLTANVMATVNRPSLSNGVSCNPRDKPGQTRYSPDPKGVVMANQIDTACMMLFPLGFVLFIAIYVHIYKSQ